MDGFLNILKPPGMTSGDVVLYIKKRLPRGTRVGHGGTLDPDACGVLPVCVGNAVRLFDYIIDKEKTYLGEITLGAVTDTQDSSGKTLEERDWQGIGRRQIEEALPRFTGTILQTPPMYSAIKKNGRRLYKMARAGQEIEVESREAQIHSLEYVSQTGENTHLLRICCGKGVYIRTLLHDIGEALGCGAHMSMLIRESAGAFSIGEAALLSQIEPEAIEGLLEPLDLPLEKYVCARVGGEHVHFVKNGNPLKPHWLSFSGEAGPGEIVRIYMDEEFVGMGEVLENGAVRFKAMLWNGPQAE
ncbi:MAG: tRNA pseudouridine(55) synthase TruB [Eubacteriales bacterium]|nr:tRNA pseudouridine(55) synthase TruB [Eubacteriales bacterium]